MSIIYLDNAATSWPKPEGMCAAIGNFYRETGANPGRSGHRLSIEAGRIMYGVRTKAAEMFGADDSLNVIFTKNSTEALNIATLGLLSEGDHVIVSGFEHNAVMRPLRYCEQRGVAITVMPPAAWGIDPDDVKRAIRPETKAVYCLHGSNVTGTVFPVAEIGLIAKEREVVFCVDASQTAGVLSIDMESMSIDMLAFTGHKSLMGPQGTGGLVLRSGLEKRLRPVLFGGTGSRSEYETQPDFLPDRFESGTPDAAGIAGLGAGMDFINSVGCDAIREKEDILASKLIEGLSNIERVRLHGFSKGAERIAVISFTVEGLSPSDVSFELDENYGIMTRPGLHCAPAAHRSIGTFPEGTVRMSPGYFTSEEDIFLAITAVKDICCRH